MTIEPAFTLSQLIEIAKDEDTYPENEFEGFNFLCNLLQAHNLNAHERLSELAEHLANKYPHSHLAESMKVDND